MADPICPECGSTRVRIVYTDDEGTDVKFYDCTICSYKWYPPGLDYDVLKELDLYLSRAETNHLLLGTRPTYVPTFYEELEHFRRFDAFLEALKKLWFECAGCGRMVAPDEESHQDQPSGSWYCLECLEEGI